MMSVLDLFRGLYLFLLHLFCISIQGNVTRYQQTLFIGDYSNRLTSTSSTDLLIDGNVKYSLLECCILCFYNQRCQNVLYHKQKSTCYGFGFYVPDDNSSIIINGMRIFNMRVEECSDTDYIYHLNICFKWVNVYITWMNGKQNCENENNHLVYLKTREKLDFISIYMRKYVTDKNWSIGLTDEMEEGKFLWLDGTPFDENTKHYFDNGNGSVQRGEQNYGTLNLKSGKIVDTDGDAKKGYICEKTINLN